MRTSFNPSKSTISRFVEPAMRSSYRCSVFVDHSCTTPPARLAAQHLSHRRLRTIALTWPTKTPACGSINQRVSSPRNEVGTFSKIITTITTASFHQTSRPRPQRARQGRIAVDLIL